MYTQPIYTHTFHNPAGGKAGGPRPWRRKGTSSVAHDPKLSLKSQGSGGQINKVNNDAAEGQYREGEDQFAVGGQDCTFSKVEAFFCVCVCVCVHARSCVVVPDNQTVRMIAVD